MRFRDPDARCGNCPHFVNESNEPLGQCRAAPAHPGFYGQGCWPLVAAGEPACGAHPNLLLVEPAAPALPAHFEQPKAMGSRKVPCPRCAGEGDLPGEDEWETCSFCNGVGTVKESRLAGR